MNCPTCKVELKMADRQGIEIDYCPKCRGVWLDRGELDKIIERSIQAEPAPAHAPPPLSSHDSHRGFLVVEVTEGDNLAAVTSAARRLARRVSDEAENAVLPVIR